MKKFIILLALALNSFCAFAHGADISSIVLVEQEDNTWTLQVRSSLNAFRKEVKLYFYDCEYESKEEFNEQLLEHLDNTLKISVNNHQNIEIGEGTIKLGHETVVLFKNIKLPKNISSLQITGSMFKEIYNSKVRVYILKKENKKVVENKTIPKKPFILSKKNNFSIDLIAKENEFVFNKRENITS